MDTDRGGALPSFLPRGITPKQALELARLVDPFDRALELSLSTRDKLNFHRITYGPKTVKTGRRKVIRELTKIAAKLKPAQEKLSCVLDTAAPARLLRIPLLTFLVKKFNYPDTTLPRGLTRGMKIAGAITKSNSLVTRFTPAAKKLKQLRGGLNRRNRHIVRAIKGATNPTLKQKCWEMSLLEYNKGWLTQPVPITKTDMKHTVKSPRFCISEQHGLQEPKYRVIGDLTRSHVNSTTDTSDAYCPQDMDALVAHVRSLAKLGASDFRARSVDFPNAYKTIGLHESPSEEATICFVEPTTNIPHKARILDQPFGSRRATTNWGRVVTFIQFIAKELLALTVGAFADDLYCAEPRGTASSGFWAFKKITKLLGSPTSDKKDQPPGKDLVLLGALIRLDDDSFCASARPCGVSKICGHVAQALQRNCLTPAAASKLRGKLGFYTSLLSGKLGRGMMGPLIARQYKNRHHQLTPELTRNLISRYIALGSLPPRITPFVFESPIGAHADAQGFGNIAAIFQGIITRTTSVHLPTWFAGLVEETPGESPIFAYELCAAILMVCITLNWPRNQHTTVVLCVDNKAAVAALVKGSSSSTIGSLLTTLFWNLASQGPITWWIEYVHTKSNHTDHPPRNCSADQNGTCNRPDGLCPPQFHRVFNSWGCPSQRGHRGTTTENE